MINKINSAAFKGTICLKAGDEREDNGIIKNIIPVSLDTSCISNIHQHEKLGYTTIQTVVPQRKGNLVSFHYVPTWFASTADILSAYTAANTSSFLHVQLEDKSSK